MRRTLLVAAKWLRSCVWGVRSIISRLYLWAVGVSFGDGLVIYSLPFCRRHPDSTIRIGNHVTIYNRLVENPAGISHRSVLLTLNPGSRIDIGNNVGLSGVVLYCSREIIVEDFVNLGVGVSVFDTDHHPTDFLARRLHDTRRIATAPVRICRDAFVGAHSIILKGVTIGERSIVGAGSVVTKDVPADSIVGGSPARLIRSRSEELCAATENNRGYSQL